MTLPEQSYIDAAGRASCPACEGFGYHDVDGEPECDVCQGAGVATVEAVQRWRDAELLERVRDPLEQWVAEVPCEKCGAPAGVICGCRS